MGPFWILAKAARFWAFSPTKTLGGMGIKSLVSGEQKGEILDLALREVEAKARDLEPTLIRLGKFGAEIKWGAGAGGNGQSPFPVWMSEMQAAAISAIMDAGRDVVEEAKRRVPVKTGRLRDSIKIQRLSRKGLSVKVGVKTSDCFYHRWVELGTRRTPKHPYLRPARDLVQPKIREYFEKYWNPS